MVLLFRQILNEDEDIAGETDGQAAANVSVSGIDGIGGERCKLLQAARRKLSPTKTSPAHIMHSFPTTSENSRCVIRRRHLCYQKVLKSGESGSIQWMCPSCRPKTVEELMP